MSESDYGGVDLDGHASAVEAEREKCAFALDSLIPGGNINLAEGESMSQMKLAIHVGVGKGAEPLLCGQLGGRIELEHLLLSPLLLNVHLI